MGTASVQCLTNSNSSFIHLVSSHTTKPLPLPKKCRNLVVVLKLLKVVLDDVISLKLSSDELFYSECESLDTAVNEAREFIENWCPKTSKICSVSSLRTSLLIFQFFFHRPLHSLSELFDFKSWKFAIILSRDKHDSQSTKPKSVGVSLEKFQIEKFQKLFA